jgi:sporulation protein YlmC with PRC-barrel domain
MAPSEDESIVPAPPEATTLDEPVSPEDAIEKSAELDAPMFATKQESNDWLASSLIGQPVVNADDEAIGHINDIVTDEDGRIVAVLVGVGGFLGLGEKDVALRYEDLSFARDEDQSITVSTELTSDVLASAPDYQRLNEQAITVGGNAADIQKDESIPSDPGAY